MWSGPMERAEVLQAILKSSRFSLWRNTPINIKTRPSVIRPSFSRKGIFRHGLLVEQPDGVHLHCETEDARSFRGAADESDLFSGGGDVWPEEEHHQDGIDG